jgi:hypothetical protein
LINQLNTVQQVIDIPIADGDVDKGENTINTDAGDVDKGEKNIKMDEFEAFIRRVRTRLEKENNSPAE